MKRCMTPAVPESPMLRFARTRLAAAVASYKELTPHRLDGSFHGPKCRRHAIGVLREFLERQVIAKIDQRLLLERLSQRQFDFDLRHPHPRFERARAVVLLPKIVPLLHHARIAKAVQLVSAQRSDPRRRRTGDLAAPPLRASDRTDRCGETAPCCGRW